ncbi:MAG: restriction endonuclease, partial [Alphaproteobacteria bacterium]|nr:restriction endonuclease [Alphaproteobacteria bacterium]
RAFGTQLLCEQVVGRGLRRYSYELNEEGLFNVEYADIMGIPFDFTAKPQVAKPVPPRKTERVKAIKERDALEIIFPRVVGYRIDLPEERLTAKFNPDSTLILTPEMVGPGQTLLEGIVGEGVTLSVAEISEFRPSTVSFHLAKHILYSYFRDEDGEPKLYLFGQIKRIVRQWIDGGYFVCKGDTGMWMLQYQDISNQAAERIYHAIASTIGDEDRVVAVLDPYNNKGSTAHVGFQTSKDLWTTAPNKSHINYVVCDSDWEAEFARVAEQHPRVISYVKNQGLGMEVPYKDGSTARRYIPDFIVQIDDGHGSDDPLNLIVEVKGYRRENVKLKSETMRNKWVPGVNNLKIFGRWAFEEFSDVYEMDKEFNALVDLVIGVQEKAA